jgi:TM2 domain-containing membrane protein YozV
MDQIPDITYRASIRYWKKPTLDYNLYWFLAVFLGWAGLDYFYLGSPLVGFAKLALTFLTFGYWWAYDAMNASFNKEQVEFAGPFVPVWGPTGIGAGRFTSKTRKGPSNPEQAAKHTHFLFYGIALFTLGVFGADSYLTGDKLSGFMRLGFMLTIILAPISILWYMFNIYRYTIRTDQCLDTFWDYFGAPKPADGDMCPNVLEMITIWFLKTALVILNLIPGFGPIVSMVQGLIDTLEEAYRTALPILETTVNTARTAINAASQVKTLAEQGVPDDAAFQKAAEEKASFAQAQAQPQTQTQTGGGYSPETPFGASLSLLSVIVIGTVVVSAVSLTFWRAYQKVRDGSRSTSNRASDEGNDKRGGEEHNDVPPDPAVFGEPADD